ncbi:MAG: hypothetical protein J6B12_03875, partial [Clostridia bacterium]|nr:hypothetical protein [Clostridia bacterium]
VQTLVELLDKILHENKTRAVFVIPNAEQGALNILYKNATVENVEYGATAVTVTAIVDAKARGMMKKYDIAPPQKEEY